MFWLQNNVRPDNSEYLEADYKSWLKWPSALSPELERYSYGQQFWLPFPLQIPGTIGFLILHYIESLDHSLVFKIYLSQIQFTVILYSGCNGMYSGCIDMIYDFWSLGWKKHDDTMNHDRY